MYNILIIDAKLVESDFKYNLDKLGLELNLKFSSNKFNFVSVVSLCKEYQNGNFDINNYDLILFHYNNEKDRQYLSNLNKNSKTILFTTEGQFTDHKKNKIGLLSKPHSHHRISYIDRSIGIHDYLRLDWERALKYITSKSDINVEILISHLLKKNSAKTLLMPFTTIDILFQGYQAIHNPDNFLNKFVHINPNFILNIKKSLENAKSEFSKSKSHRHWFEECYKDETLTLFAECSPQPNENLQLRNQTKYFDKQILTVEDEDNIFSTMQFLEILGSDEILSALKLPRFDGGEELINICDSISKWAKDDQTTDDTISPPTVEKANRALQEAFYLGCSDRCHAPMANARIRLNHDDIKNLLHYLNYFGEEQNHSNLEILLKCAWPNLSKKIIDFLDAVRKIWCLHEPRFQNDTYLVKGVVSSIDKIAKTYNQSLSTNIHKDIEDHLKRLYSYQDNNTPGLLSGEYFDKYTFELMPVSESISTDDGIKEAINLTNIIKEKLNNIIGKNVKDILCDKYLWKARYNLDSYLWNPAVRKGQKGREALIACHRFIYDSLRVFIDTLLELNKNALAEDIIKVTDHRPEFGKSGLELLLNQLNAFEEKLKNLDTK